MGDTKVFEAGDTLILLEGTTATGALSSVTIARRRLSGDAATVEVDYQLVVEEAKATAVKEKTETNLTPEKVQEKTTAALATNDAVPATMNITVTATAPVVEEAVDFTPMDLPEGIKLADVEAADPTISVAPAAAGTTTTSSAAGLFAGASVSALLLLAF